MILDDENRWSDLHPLVRALISLAAAILVYAALHLAGHPFYGPTGSVLVSVCMWVVTYFLGGVLLVLADLASEYLLWWR